MMAVAHQMDRADHGRSHLVLDEGMSPAPRFFIGELRRRRFHEVTRWAGQRAAEPAIHGKLRAADRIDHHAGGIGRVPDFEAYYGVKRDAPEGGALEPNIGKLPIS